MSDRLKAHGIVYADCAKKQLSRLCPRDRDGIAKALKNQAPIAFNEHDRVRCKGDADPVWRAKYHPPRHPDGGIRALYVARHWKDLLVMYVVGIFKRNDNPYGDNR